MVVDLAVGGDPDRVVLIGHRLLTGVGAVDDRQPAVPERDPPGSAHRGVPSVWSTVPQRVRHAGDRRLVGGKLVVDPSAAPAMPHTLAPLYADARTTG